MSGFETTRGDHANLLLRLSLNPNGSEELVRVAFFAWAQLHGKDRMSEEDILQLRSHHHAPAVLWDFYCGTSLINPTTHSTVKRIFEDVGVEQSIHAAEHTLKWSFLMTGASLLTCIKMLTLLHNMFVSSSLLSKNAMLPAMATAFDRQKTRLRFAESQGQGKGPDVSLSQRMDAVSAACEHIKYARSM